MSDKTTKAFEDAYKRELVAKREGAGTFAFLCSVMFGVGLLGAFGINLLGAQLILAPFGIFVGLLEYHNYSKKIKEGGLPTYSPKD